MKQAPLVLLGLDVGDIDAIRKWVHEGRLPTIASIMEDGCWGRTTGPEFVCEYGTALSLFSGVSCREHGFFYFRQLEPGTYDLKTVRPRDTTALPFWGYLHDRDRRVLVVDPPETDIVPGLPGLQLTEWALHHTATPPAAEPPHLLDEVEKIFGPQIKIVVEPEGSENQDRDIFRRLIERIKKKGLLCRELLKREEFDLVVAVFSETDPASHQFWKYRPEARPAENNGPEHDLTNALRDVYDAVDREFGLLLAELPAGANVVIFSLFGMHDQYPTPRLIEPFLRELGYQASPRGSDDDTDRSRSFSALGLARRVIPESWRVAISNYLPGDVQERLLAEQLRTQTDWSRTTAFSIPGLFTSFVRVNLRGREPDGIVEPGGEYLQILDQLETDLRLLVDPKTGEPAVMKISRTVDEFGCEPHLVLPDLFVEWAAVPHFLDEVVHPRARLTQPKPKHFVSSQEKLSGFVAASGPAIAARGDLGEISLLDLAPSFLTLMGEPTPSRMTGNALAAILARDPI